METIGEDFIGSIMSAGRLLVLMIPLYFAVIGLYFYMRHRMADPHRRLGSLDEKGLKDVTGEWFGDKEERAEAKTVAVSDLGHDWQIAEGVMLAGADGAFHSIDYLINTGEGIIVLQRAAEVGEIFGTEIEDNWRQDLRGKVFEFPNPLRRNESCVAAVQSLFEGDREKAASAVWGRVVFGREAILPEGEEADKRLLTVEDMVEGLTAGKGENDISGEETAAYWEILTKQATIAKGHAGCDVLLTMRDEKPISPNFLTVLRRPSNLILLAILIVLLVLVFKMGR